MAVDLSLLPHLSERALRDEAERRGIEPAGLDKAELVAAIRAHEGRAITVPPKQGPKAYADTVPPRAPAEELEDEPIRTRSMATLLEQQGHVARALSIVRFLSGAAPADAELARWRESLEAEVAWVRLRERAAAWAGPRCAVEVMASGGARVVVWRVDDAGRARARALLGAEGALTLRVVRVSATEDQVVESTIEDTACTAHGHADVDAPAGAKVIAAVGLVDAGRFVSIAHASG